MMSRLIKGVALVASVVSSLAFAFDFSRADELFMHRGDGIAAINAARAAYREALPSVTNSDKVHAYVMLARLDSYQGYSGTGATSDANQDERKSLFAQCLTDLESIRSETSPEYYYWKSICLASWGQANGVLASLRRSRELVDLLEKGNAIDSRYEGGGFYRLLSAVYFGLPSFNPFGPAGNIDKALAMAEAAIAAPAYPGSPNPETATGDYFFNIYNVKANILDAKGRRSEAIQTVQDAIDRIEAGDLPLRDLPETMQYLQELKATLARLHK